MVSARLYRGWVWRRSDCGVREAVARQDHDPFEPMSTVPGMTPNLRKLVLTTHVTFTVGWLGAVVVFLALALLGSTSQNAQIVRGVYLVMEPTAWSVLVPLACASLLTGIIQSFGTPWGFFRYYWVVYKL